MEKKLSSKKSVGKHLFYPIARFVLRT